MQRVGVQCQWQRLRRKLTDVKLTIGQWGDVSKLPPSELKSLYHKAFMLDLKISLPKIRSLSALFDSILETRIPEGEKSKLMNQARQLQAQLDGIVQELRQLEQQAILAIFDDEHVTAAK